MMCQSCSREAEWLIVTPGAAWTGRVCSEHLAGTRIDVRARVYPRTPIAQKVRTGETCTPVPPRAGVTASSVQITGLSTGPGHAYGTEL